MNRTQRNRLSRRANRAARDRARFIGPPLVGFYKGEPVFRGRPGQIAYVDDFGHGKLFFADPRRDAH